MSSDARFFKISSLQELFGIDTRALAAVRVALAVLIILDLIARSRSLFAFYDDKGTFPRSYLLTDFAGYWDFSLHMISGAWPLQAILFIAAGVFALMLLVGYRTRLATIVTWLLLLSVHNRNPLILQAGDVLLRMGLFWGMFLPWGSSLSLDAALKTPTARQRLVTSAATVAILGQVTLVYLGGALHKSRDVWFTQGHALYGALNLDGFTTAFGTWLLQWPLFLTTASRGTYLLELFGPLLLFTPFFTQRIRFLMVLLFISFHVGIASTLKIGLFAWTDIAMLSIFLPPLFWDTMAAAIKRRSTSPLTIYYDSDCSFCWKIVRVIETFLLPYNTAVLPATTDVAIAQLMMEKSSWVVVDRQDQRHLGYDGVCTVVAASPFTRLLAPLMRHRRLVSIGERVYAWIAHRRQFTCVPGSAPATAAQGRNTSLGSIFAQTVAAGFFALVIAWNIAAYPGVTWKVPTQLHWLVSLTRVDQHWGMFAPFPPYDDGWYVMPGTLQNGTSADVFRQTSFVSWEKPPSVSSTYADQYWRKYLMLLTDDRYAKARSYYAQYLCSRWNRSHDSDHQLTSFSIYYILERTPPTRHDPPVPLEYKLQLEHQCPR